MGNGGRMKPMGEWLIGIVAVIIIVLGAGLWMQRSWDGRWNGNVNTIAATSLQGLREQNRLSAFAARFVAVVTSEQNRFGLTAQKTLIMPGMVRYEVDLSKLAQRDVVWDDATKILTISLPAIEVSGPEVDMTAIREYDGGGILLALTNAEKTLDEANRKRGQAELLRQAHEAVPMQLARDATRRAITTNFAMPLKAAGVDAQIVVKFAWE